MFDRFISFINNMSFDGASGKAGEFTPDDPRLCAAALMYHIVQADGVMTDDEEARFKALVKAENKIEGEELKKLLEAAKAAEAEAVDLYRFTSGIGRVLDPEQRIHFIELLWELVYADGERQEVEDNIVWRISELLGVDTRDRIAMRQRVEARMGDTKISDA